MHWSTFGWRIWDSSAHHLCVLPINFPNLQIDTCCSTAQGSAERAWIPPNWTRLTQDWVQEMSSFTVTTEESVLALQLTDLDVRSNPALSGICESQGQIGKDTLTILGGPSTRMNLTVLPFSSGISRSSMLIGVFLSRIWSTPPCSVLLVNSSWSESYSSFVILAKLM